MRALALILLIGSAVFATLWARRAERARRDRQSKEAWRRYLRRRAMLTGRSIKVEPWDGSA